MLSTFDIIHYNYKCPFCKIELANNHTCNRYSCHFTAYEFAKSIWIDTMLFMINIDYENDKISISKKGSENKDWYFPIKEFNNFDWTWDTLESKIDNLIFFS